MPQVPKHFSGNCEKKMEILGFTFSGGSLWLLASAGAAITWLVVHTLAAQRDRVNRLALASSTFRVAIHTAIAPIPSASAHWGTNTLIAIPVACQGIDLAVKNFAPSLGGKRRSLEAEWQILKRHCEQTIPNALSTANLLYHASSGGPDPTVAKEKFHAHVKNLLAFAEA
jgi:hypothetical protein